MVGEIGVERGETIIKVPYVEKKSIFNKIKNEYIKI